MQKKAVSPVIATVLLVAIVIVIALLIFIWMRSFVQEAGQKMGKSADQVCDEVNLDASIDESSLIVLNNGNVPVYSIIIEKTSEGSTESEKFENRTLGQGSSDIYDLGGTGWDKVEIIPIIMVEMKGARAEYLCEDSRKEVL